MIVIVPYVHKFVSRQGVAPELPYEGYRATFEETEGIGKTPQAAVDNLRTSHAYLVSVGVKLEPFPSNEEVERSIALTPMPLPKRRAA